MLLREPVSHLMLLWLAGFWYGIGFDRRKETVDTVDHNFSDTITMSLPSLLADDDAWRSPHNIASVFCMSSHSVFCEPRCLFGVKT